MALTATASRETVKTIVKTLGMKKSLCTINVTPSKPNLCYAVLHKEHMDELVSQIVSKIKQLHGNKNA